MPFRKPWFEKSRDRRWICLFVPLWAAVCAVLAVSSCVMLGYSPSLVDIGVWACMAAVAAAFLCGFGYANLKIAFAFTLAGILAGLAVMVYVFAQPIDQRGIVGLVTCVELGAVFFMVGVCIQMVKHLAQVRR